MKIGPMWNHIKASSRSKSANEEPKLKDNVVTRRCKPFASHFNDIIGSKDKYGELNSSAICKEIG